MAGTSGGAAGGGVLRFMLASGNRHKLGEFCGILAPHDVIAMPPGIELPPEGTVSFEANAIGKARGLARALAAAPSGARENAEAAGAIVIADDSGIEVEELGWAPGVLSARFAGEDAGDRDNYELLLRRLHGVPPSGRRARFVCVLAAVVPGLPPAAGDDAAGPLLAGDAAVTSPSSASSPRLGLEPLLYAVRGDWWGTITQEPHGDGGFGYDPVFLPDGSDLTVAELPQSVKDQASHRALAGRALLERLENEGVFEVRQT